MRPARFFLLGLSLALLAFSTRALALDSVPNYPEIIERPAPWIHSEEITEGELTALNLAFRGFLAVALPGGNHGCIGRLANDYVRRHEDYYRAWYTVKIESSCEGKELVTEEIWFQCTSRNQLRCTLSVPLDPAVVRQQSAR